MEGKREPFKNEDARSVFPTSADRCDFCSGCQLAGVKARRDLAAKTGCNLVATPSRLQLFSPSNLKYFQFFALVTSECIGIRIQEEQPSFQARHYYGVTSNNAREALQLLETNCCESKKQKGVQWHDCRQLSPPMSAKMRRSVVLLQQTDGWRLPTYLFPLCL